MSDPITRNGSGYSAPRDSNRVPVIFGVSTVDGVTPVPAEVNPSTGQLQTSSSGSGGGGTQYQELATTSPAQGTLALGRYQTSLPTLTNGQLNEPMLDATSTLLVNSSTLATAANQTTMNSNLTSIVTNTAAGATSANQTNGTQQSKITDGTNVANVVAGDTGYNGVATNSGGKSITFTTSGTGAQDLGPFNTEGYSWISVQFNAATVGSGVTVAGQFSLDSADWNSATNWHSAVDTQSVSTALSSVALLFTAPISGTSFRLHYTAITGGTSAGTIWLSNGAKAPTTMGVSAAQSGTWNIGGASSAALADSTTNPTTQPIGAFAESYNGTTWDKLRSNTSVVVVAAGQTSTTTQTLTTYNARSLVLAVNITAGAGTLTVAISGSTTSAYTYPILTSTALTGIADNTLRVFPGATPATNTTANDALPRTVSITYTVSGSVTFGSDAVLSV